MEELDVLEKEVIKAITKCSEFDILTVKYVYNQTKSFDKTILVLKTSVEHNMRVSTVLSFENMIDRLSK